MKRTLPLVIGLLASGLTYAQVSYKPIKESSPTEILDKDFKRLNVSGALVSHADQDENQYNVSASLSALPHKNIFITVGAGNYSTSADVSAYVNIQGATLTEGLLYLEFGGGVRNPVIVQSGIYDFYLSGIYKLGTYSLTGKAPGYQTEVLIDEDASGYEVKGGIRMVNNSLPALKTGMALSYSSYFLTNSILSDQEYQEVKKEMTDYFGGMLIQSEFIYQFDPNLSFGLDAMFDIKFKRPTLGLNFSINF